MTQIRRITKESEKDLRLKNEPFSMPGRFIPELKDGIWRYRIEPFQAAQQMCFPDENYDFEECNAGGALFGAYENGVCIGVAIYLEAFLKYFYLYDLKVCASARGKGVGSALIKAGLREAKRRGYLGLYTQAQDNNVNACLFYLKNGFVIGGFDNRIYRGTSQAEKADVFFYLDA